MQACTAEVIRRDLNSNLDEWSYCVSWRTRKWIRTCSNGFLQISRDLLLDSVCTLFVKPVLRRLEDSTEKCRELALVSLLQWVFNFSLVLSKYDGRAYPTARICVCKYKDICIDWAYTWVGKLVSNVSLFWFGYPLWCGYACTTSIPYTVLVCWQWSGSCLYWLVCIPFHNITFFLYQKLVRSSFADCVFWIACPVLCINSQMWCSSCYHTPFPCCASGLHWSRILFGMWAWNPVDHFDEGLRGEIPKNIGVSSWLYILFLDIWNRGPVFEKSPGLYYI